MAAYIPPVSHNNVMNTAYFNSQDFSSAKAITKLPCGRASGNSTTTFTNGATITAVLNTTNLATGGMPSMSNNGFTVPLAGIYNVTFMVNFSTSTGSTFSISSAINGVANNYSSTVTASNTSMTSVLLLNLNKGDLVQGFILFFGTSAVSNSTSVTLNVQFVSIA